MKFATTSILIISAALPVLAGIQEVWWNITYVENVNPDGLYPRRVIGVNGTWPPPPLDVHAANSLQLHVINSLDQPTTLHHHGMLFNSMPWMDGVKGVSECGIPPGGTFDYLVPINSSGQFGTYWVHAHSKGQYVDGLRAPLIIHPVEKTFSYDDEFTVVLSDWYHEEHPELMKRFLSPSNPDGIEPVADSALLYFARNASYLPAKTSNTSSSTVGFNENATLPFEAGKTYRLRLINTSAFAMFYFWIDGHDMKIIEVDGIDVEETPVSAVNLAVAQRYSVLVTARNETSSNWAIHANMDTDMFDYVPDSLNPNITSSVTYNDSTAIQDNGPIAQYTPIDDMTLVPKAPIAAPEATRTILLEGTLDIMDDGTNRGMFNLFPYGPSTFLLNHNEVVDIVLKNGDDGDHPFHLHGHVPMLIERVDPKNVNLVSMANLTNPLRRDTFHIPAEGSVTLRVVADNPGVWFLHCHMEWHLESGLAIQFVEAPFEAQALSGNIPSDMYSNCKKLGIPYSGNAAAHASATDLSGLPLGPYPRKQKKFANWAVFRYLELRSVKYIVRWAFLASPFMVLLVVAYSHGQRSSTSLQDKKV
ncbi:Cupredoxin [Gymnopus androsaceus JB14]|uniref:Cupredoxin n=1 Tax=Gymnopus androsaceus JB14 TaxID=1447944 RepID=A0A6A4H1A2_9AGAR|nr:Cupredoxin [Gymnopus androsaceus JB14]